MNYKKSAALVIGAILSTSSMSHANCDELKSEYGKPVAVCSSYSSHDPYYVYLYKINESEWKFCGYDAVNDNTEVLDVTKEVRRDRWERTDSEHVNFEANNKVIFSIPLNYETANKRTEDRPGHRVYDDYTGYFGQDYQRYANDIGDRFGDGLFAIGCINPRLK